MRYLRSKAVPNSWAAVVGAGLGGLLLLWNDVVGYPSSGCRQLDRGYACRGPGVVEAFWFSTGVVVVGVLLGVFSSLQDRRPRSSVE